MRRLPTLDALRGLASLAVAWFHFSNGEWVPPGLLKASGHFGWVGVEVFFVISGFVIPYALRRSDYAVGSYGRFILKRLVRLDPPYLAAIALALLLGYLSTLAPGFRGRPFEFSWPRLLLHFGYLNVLFGYEWLNPVFWTLAIEFQYYLLVGLLYPALASERRWFAPALVVAATLASALVPSTDFIFRYLPLFAMGVLTFRRHAGLSGRDYLPGVVALGLATALFVDVPSAVAGTGGALLVAYATIDSRTLRFFGDISYSLYLLHAPVGGRVMNLTARLPAGFAPLACLCALAASVLAAYALYRLVERPAREWSSKIKYREGRTPETLVDVQAL